MNTIRHYSFPVRALKMTGVLDYPKCFLFPVSGEITLGAKLGHVAL